LVILAFVVRAAPGQEGLASTLDAWTLAIPAMSAHRLDLEDRQTVPLRLV
jgi:hypothetical protein